MTIPPEGSEQQVDAEDHERWDPPFETDWFYRVSINLDGFDPIEVSATVPNLDSVDLSTATLSRIGGASERDWAFRRELYFWVGLATVASGKIESAMKRAILIGKHQRVGAFSVVDETWTRLDRMLRTVAEAQTKSPTFGEGWGAHVVSTLNWGREHRAKERRDSIVHAYWWDFADTNVMRGRFYRSGESATLATDFKRMRHDGEVLLTYASMLEELTGPNWLNLYLPRENPKDAEAESRIAWTRTPRSGPATSPDQSTPD